MIVGVIRRKPVLTYASIVCDMLASVNSVNMNHGDRLLYGHSQCQMSRLVIHDHHHGDQPGERPSTVLKLLNKLAAEVCMLSVV